MRIPMKVDYGVRALVELASIYGEGQVRTADIAYRQGIPEAYLDQLMTTLNKFGFVISRRGPQGGHKLAMPPSRDRPGHDNEDPGWKLLPIRLLHQSGRLRVFRIPALSRKFGSLWRDAVQEVLGNITLADLSQRQKTLAGSRA